MSAELDGCRIPEAIHPHDEDGYSGAASYSPDLPRRQNLAGGTGVFANFFEELASTQTSDTVPQNANTTEYPPITPESSHPVMQLDSQNPMSAFYGGVADDDDLVILDQYKGFVNRPKGTPTNLSPGYFPGSPSGQSPWDAGNSYIAQTGGITEYFRPEMGSNMCISYAPRCKPPKILGKRFLLGDTIGRGSYGKVKDAIDLITFRRHAVKIINKFAIRKIPGGWSQALAEAAVMRRLPPNRHIVSLATVLRLENPDRLCMVMEHCLGSVHDLQSAGVPFTSFDPDDLDVATSQPTRRTKDRRLRTQSSRRFPLPCPMISTDTKQPETKRLTDVFKRRKVSQLDPGYHRKQSMEQQSQQQQQQFRRLPEAQAHAYFLQLIDGLYFLHQNGVIHRDIKPANLLLTPAPGCGLSSLFSMSETMNAPEACWLNQVGDGQPGFLGRSLSNLLAASRGWLVKLTDFGVSASLSAFSQSQQVSVGQTTPAVQPPEIAKGIQTVFDGPQLDVYSAGVTLYFMLTGRVPFSCQNVLQIFEAIAQGDYVIPGHVSSRAAHLVRKMMHKDPKKRYTLHQVSKHPWVMNDPVPPITLEDIRARLRARPMSSSSERGFVYWLEPLELLRRPYGEHPLPHIDDTGARIVCREESEEKPEDPIQQDLASSAGSSDSKELEPGVAPLSVLNALRVHHAMMQTGTDEPIQPDGVMERVQANQWVLTDQLAQLGIHPESTFVSDLIPSWHSPVAYSGPGPKEPYAIPSGSPPTNRQQPSTVKFITDHDYYEPPPEDLPVAEPACCLSGPQVSFATVAPGGSLRAVNLHAYTDDDLERSRHSGSTNNNNTTKNQSTWHAGSSQTSQLPNLSKLRFSLRVQTVDSGLARHNLDVPASSSTATSTRKLASPSRPNSNSSTSIHRRLSQWWSNSMLSLRKRLRRRPQSDVAHSLSPDRHADSEMIHSSDPDALPLPPPPRMSSSVDASPNCTLSHSHRTRGRGLFGRWRRLSARSVKR